MPKSRAFRQAAVVFGLSAAMAGFAAADVLEPGAGPIQMQATPCWMAKHDKRMTPCEPPAVPLEAQSTEERAAAHLKRALFFIETETLPEARRELDAVLAAQPNVATVRHLSARLALTMGDTERAGSDIALARQLDPKNPDIHATFAQQLEWRPAPLEALREYDAILTRLPAHAHARFKRAQLLLSLNLPLAALRDLDVLVSDDRPSPRHLELRAAVNLKLGQPHRAAEDYTAALKQEPGSSYLLVERATAYERAGNDSAAIADLDTLLAQIGGKPAYAIAGDRRAKLLTQRALLLVRMKRFDDAASDMAAALLEGGTTTVLRAQIFLRQNGFPDVPLDGRTSETLEQALQSCFGLNACFQGITRKI